MNPAEAVDRLNENNGSSIPFWLRWTVGTLVAVELCGMAIVALLAAIADLGVFSSFDFYAQLTLIAAAGAVGGGSVQAWMLVGRLPKAGRWLTATTLGGFASMAWSVVTLIGIDWIVYRLTGASGLYSWPLWVAVSPVGALPVAIWQSRLLLPMPRAVAWPRLVLLTVAVASPAAAFAALVVFMLAERWLLPLTYHYAWARVLVDGVPMAAGVAIGWGLTGLATGQRLHRMLADWN